MSEIRPEKKNLVVVAAAVVCMAAAAPTLTRGYPRVGWVWGGLILVALVYLIVLLVRSQKDGAK
jgi:hypothetical protein